jgi:hypothetical protein
MIQFIDAETSKRIDRLAADRQPSTDRGGRRASFASDVFSWRWRLGQYMKRRYFILAAVGLAAIAIGWLEARDLREQAERKLAYSVVSELGGQIGSPTPPVPYSDSEIRIEFKGKKFPVGELPRLVVLNSLTKRNDIGIMFRDTDVSAADTGNRKFRIARPARGTLSPRAFDSHSYRS